MKLLDFLSTVNATQGKMFLAGIFAIFFLAGGFFFARKAHVAMVWLISGVIGVLLGMLGLKVLMDAANYSFVERSEKVAHAQMMDESKKNVETTHEEGAPANSGPGPGLNVGEAIAKERTRQAQIRHDLAETLAKLSKLTEGVRLELTFKPEQATKLAKAIEDLRKKTELGVEDCSKEREALEKLLTEEQLVMLKAIPSSPLPPVAAVAVAAGPGGDSGKIDMGSAKNPISDEKYAPVVDGLLAKLGEAAKNAESSATPEKSGEAPKENSTDELPADKSADGDKASPGA